MSGNASDQASKTTGPAGLSRRGFLKGVGAISAGAVMTEDLLLRADKAAAETAPTTQAADGTMNIVLDVNGQSRAVSVETRTTLLSALRDRLDPPVTGPKLVCNMATCGACTVILDGKTVYGCSVLAVDAVGKKVTTVEGLGTPDNLNAVQAAFIEKDAMMCGFCTPGFVTTVSHLLEKNPKPTLEQVREECKGNFCRCGTYPHIFEAAMKAAEAKK